jgi:hypothetical protein
VLWIGLALDVEREDGGVLPEAHEQQALVTAGKLGDQLRRQVGDLPAAILLLFDEGLTVPQRDAEALVGSQPPGEPLGVGAAVAGAVQRIAGEGVLEGIERHGRGL